MLFLQIPYAADVVSTFKAAAGSWSDSTKWTNSPALGGFPNNGNAGVATYDATVPGADTVTLDTNIVIQKLTQAGTVSGSLNLTTKDLHTWTSGTLGGTGTNFDNGGLAITGTATLSARQLQMILSPSLTAASLHLAPPA